MDRGYNALDHFVETPMSGALLKSLRKKGTDLRFMCQEVCSAAVAEGSKTYPTRLLASIRDERRFHKQLQRHLPKVETLKFPVAVKKQLASKDFST
ncbi:unnamed protein product [Symbiodinium necroappetens]|uniref:Uncharacterized protein n=1 Tax=Symbiodinium necroappetens TaxID=1628268 RepID=A0A812X4U4_9DINO|nr:unnamed protein product [Symbiodinium necroappetens]